MLCLLDYYALLFERSSTNVNSLLIRHARILLADGEWLVGDVLVRDERIVEIGTRITATEVSRGIDATGLVLLPGVINPQVHFREPAVHSQIQDNQAALNATQLALGLSKKYQRRLHILYLSTAEEVELLRQDKLACQCKNSIAWYFGRIYYN